MEIIKADVLIIGSGIAGLFAAHLLSTHKKVILITKSNVIHSNSYLAQGGIAASINKKDHWKKHLTDTFTAGNFHHIEETTELMIKSAPSLISELVNLGVPFDCEPDDSLTLGREGGHHQRRVVHSGGDSTGKNVIETLLASVRNKVRIDEYVTAYDLSISDGQCVGVYAKNKDGTTIFYQAQQTVIATGGAGGVYSVSSNSSTVTGDGLVMAYRAGAELVDIEFMQFHPTVLFHNEKAHGLISEAVRGEGAILVTQYGKPIMEEIHPLKDLAPRDIVARRIFEVINQGDQVFLDISMIPNFQDHFPSITAISLKSGLDLKNQLLPVVPASHFLMGGIKTNQHGETSIPKLYAIGEAAFTGVHGANRLASNSLLEGLFFAKQITKSILKKTDSCLAVPSLSVENYLYRQIPFPSSEKIREIMQKHVAIVRDYDGLIHAKTWFEGYLSVLDPLHTISLTREQLTRLNMLTLGWLMVNSALKRTESRGAHYRIDYPKTDEINWKKRYIVQRRENNEYNQTKIVATTTVY